MTTGYCQRKRCNGWHGSFGCRSRVFYMKFIPVVEFGIENFRKDDRDYVPIDHPNYKEASRIFWRQMLSDWGITNLLPYEPDSWFVRISDMSQEILEILVERHLVDCDVNEADEISSFEGGFILETKNGPFYPQCCGSLSDIAEWRDAVKTNDTEGCDLWVGHPMFLMKSINNDTVELSETHEYPSDVELNSIILNRTNLSKAIKSAEEELFVFEGHITNILRKIPCDKPKLVAKILSGLSDF